MALENSIAINSGINLKLSWNTFKEIIQAKNLNIQYIQKSSGEYTLFSIDDRIIYTTFIFSGSIPFGWHSTQEENDLELGDFELNYKYLSNKPMNYRSSLGDIAIAAAKGMGNFVPDPTNNPYQPAADERVSLYTDGEGSLVTRGNALTDEGSFRDEFTGVSLETTLTGDITMNSGSFYLLGSGSLFTEELSREYYIRPVGYTSDDWKPIIRVPNNEAGEVEGYYNTTVSGSFEKTKWISRLNDNGSYLVTSSIVSLMVNTSASAYSKISRNADYCPIFCMINAKIDNRINNQLSIFGFVDDATNPMAKIVVQFDGTDNSKIKFITTHSDLSEEKEESEISLPVGLTTNDFLNYGIFFNGSTAILTVNDIFMVKHRNHLPDIYGEMQIYGSIENIDSTISSSILSFDTVYFSNQNRLEIANSFQEPIPIIVKEDFHTITGTLTTTSTTSDQIILSYTVPSNKIFYIVGYSIAANGSANGTPIKIGKNDLSSEPGSPGEVDSNIFRVFNWTITSVGSNIEMDYGGTPRKFASGGDVVKITVSPSSLLSTCWRATLDFILR